MRWHLLAAASPPHVGGTDGSGAQLLEESLSVCEAGVGGGGGGGGDSWYRKKQMC